MKLKISITDKSSAKKIPYARVNGEVFKLSSTKKFKKFKKLEEEFTDENGRISYSWKGVEAGEYKIELKVFELHNPNPVTKTEPHQQIVKT